MTETDLVALCLEILNANYIIVGGYISVTAALYTVAYMTGTNLKIRSLIFIIITYFSIMVALTLLHVIYIEALSGAVESLINLNSDGVQLSQLSGVLIGQLEAREGLWIALALLVLPFEIGAIVYLIYQYRISRASISNENESSTINT